MEKQRNERSNQVVFDWAGASFVGVSLLTAYTALHCKVSFDGCEVAVNAPANDCGIDRYISRMNYYEHVGINREENFNRHSEGDRFIPITKFSSTESRSDLPEKVSQTIVSHTPLSSNVKASVDYMFGEVMDNVCEHAQSGIGGFIGAQYYPAKQMLELCIADGGCSIPTSLRRNVLFSGMEDIDLLPKALEYGVGENVDGQRGTRGYGRGKGLSFISNMVARSQGLMRIVSGCAGVCVSCDSEERMPAVYFPGTLVSIEIPTNASHEISAEALFSGMEGSVLLDTLLEKYQPMKNYDEHDNNILW